MLKRKNYPILWFSLVILAFLLRFGAAVYWERYVTASSKDKENCQQTTSCEACFFFGDSDSYWRLGRALAFHRPYQFDEERCWQIFRTPGYPAILVPLFWIFGENPPVFAARLLGILFGILNVLLTGLLTIRLLGNRSIQTQWIALLAGFFFAVDPTLVFQSILVLSEEPFVTFALLQNICLVDCARKIGILPHPPRDMRILQADSEYVEWSLPLPCPLLRLCTTALFLGLTTAATIYLRPSWYYYLPFATFVLLLFRWFTGSVHEIDDYQYSPWETRFQWNKLISTSLVTFFVVILALTPWITRNYRLTGKYIPTTLQLGAGLYDGLNPTATGASNMDFVDVFREAEKTNPSSVTDIHFEVRLDERIKRAAIDWTIAHPYRALSLAGVKLYRLWAPIPNEKAFKRPFLQAVLAFSFIPIFILGLNGAFLSLRNKGVLWSLLLPAIYVSILHSIFVSSIRYRTPTLYGFFILTAYLIAILFKKFIIRRQNKV